jgi:Ca-activated chloride channel family protein
VVKAEDLEVRYRALFNAGLAQLSAGLQLSGARREAALDAALDSYRGALLMRPDDVDAKWNYELALREREGGGGGGGQQQQEQNPQESRGSESEQRQAPSGLGRDQAEQLLDNAARDERDVQARAQDRNRPSRPPGGKDW